MERVLEHLFNNNKIKKILNDLRKYNFVFNQDILKVFNFIM